LLSLFERVETAQKITAPSFLLSKATLTDYELEEMFTLCVIPVTFAYDASLAAGTLIEPSV
jgi:hypothetical protein